LSEYSERSGKEFGIKPRSSNESSWSQVLGDKILQELPEELAASTAFKVDEKERLCMFFGFKLAGPNFQVVLDVVRRFQGDFVNKKEDGRDVGYFMFPKLEPTDSVPVVAPAVEVVQEKLVEAPKQPSPISLFTRDFCSVCEDNQKCDVSVEGGRFHRAMCLQLLDLEQMRMLNVNLEKLGKHAVSQPVQAASPAPAAPQIQKVERNTRPAEGHQEGGIVWIYAENQKGERYEKALEKDNARSDPYFDLRDQIVERVNAGKKGLELAGKWLWLSDRDDYIGKKVAKQFPKGVRR
jgi:hypothetical protein